MFERDYLIIKTDQMFNIWIQYVSAVNVRYALIRAEKISDWQDTLYDDSILEGLDIYPNDIQAVRI
tara:strand:+ start:489 stop:686 length:198 start_codon:yes stop_codon:yes gene_type:complete